MNPSRMQKLHKECWEKVISGKDETMQNRKEIVMINVANIYPHPDNPRKDVGNSSASFDRRTGGTAGR